MNAEAKLTEAMNGLVDIQAHLVGMGKPRATLGQRILESKNFEGFKGGSGGFSIDLHPSEIKAVVSTGALGDPLVVPEAPQIDVGKRRKINVRSLLPVYPTLSGAVEMPRKTGATLGSPVVQNRENTAFPETSYSFDNSHVAIQTLGHIAKTSRQVFDDSGTLNAFLNTELLQGLEEEQQNQILNGTASNSELDGLLANATAYSFQSPQLTDKADILRDAMRQIEVADFNPTAIVLHPDDWYAIDTAKASTSDNSYSASNPRLIRERVLWGLPVVVTNDIASGTFLVGDFARAAILFDRQSPKIEISDHDSDNFIKGVVTFKATMRLAQVVTNPLALVKGSL